MPHLCNLCMNQAPSTIGGTCATCSVKATFNFEPIDPPASTAELEKSLSNAQDNLLTIGGTLKRTEESFEKKCEELDNLRAGFHDLVEARRRDGLHHIKLVEIVHDAQEHIEKEGELPF